VAQGHPVTQAAVFVDITLWGRLAIETNDQCVVQGFSVAVNVAILAENLDQALKRVAMAVPTNDAIYPRGDSQIKFVKARNHAWRRKSRRQRTCRSGVG
jgi:hypothetical protein